MNKLQQAQYNAFSVTLEHMFLNIEIVKTVPVFEMIIGSAQALLHAIKNINQRMLADTSGLKDQKDATRQSLAEMAHHISSVLFTYASINKDHELKKLVKFTFSELNEVPDKLAERSKLILDNAKELLPQLGQYGINMNLLNNFTTMISEFEGVINVPRGTTADGANDTKALAGLFTETRRVFKEHIHPMMVGFKNTHKDFYGQYKERKKIIDPYTRHTALAATVTDKEGLPLAGVTVRIDGTAFKGTTGDNGTVEMKVPLTGKIMIVISKEGYREQRVEKTLSKGKIATFTTVINSII